MKSLATQYCIEGDGFFRPDKTAIKKFIKEHGNKDWARLTDNNEYSLTIK